ncbi:hypothetical protein BDQ12DRAFT_362753 [Crucibulum laeve]|uniref:Uncharacterized protein n=1 Tax=Crucibulum laeve TaxID=68775 RepID=A0A5C3LQC7_9AGAR|nr:hypothetical protein BDQ12DRAFT_362753 [Crucibulum laeve]
MLGLLEISRAGSEQQLPMLYGPEGWYLVENSRFFCLMGMGSSSADLHTHSARYQPSCGCRSSTDYGQSPRLLLGTTLPAFSKRPCPVVDRCPLISTQDLLCDLTLPEQSSSFHVCSLILVSLGTRRVRISLLYSYVLSSSRHLHLFTFHHPFLIISLSLPLPCHSFPPIPNVQPPSTPLPTARFPYPVHIALASSQLFILSSLLSFFFFFSGFEGILVVVNPSPSHHFLLKTNSIF